jgi:hypothetical protein
MASRRRQRARPRRSKRQRELLGAADELGGGGALLVLVGLGVALAGGSATLAWSVGTAGAWMLGFALLVPLVARFPRLSWRLVAAGASAAVVGGAAYLLAPSDATWWLGQLGAVPLVVLWAYFGPGRKREPGEQGSPWAPPGA